MYIGEIINSRLAAGFGAVIVLVLLIAYSELYTAGQLVEAPDILESNLFGRLDSYSGERTGFKVVVKEKGDGIVVFEKFGKDYTLWLESAVDFETGDELWVYGEWDELTGRFVGEALFNFRANALRLALSVVGLGIFLFACRKKFAVDFKRLKIRVGGEDA